MTATVATAISARWESHFVQEMAESELVELSRRCADVAELLSVAEAGTATLAALSADFPGVDGQLIAELTMRGVSVLGVASPTSLVDARAFEAWGVKHVHLIGSGELEATVSALGTAHDEVLDEPEAPLPADDTQVEHEGDVIVVWGPAGAPGRSVTSAHLADALSVHDRVLLIDADTYAPSLAGVLGVLDDAPGILAAARLIDAGNLNAHQLRRVATEISPTLDLLTGIGRSERWAEISAHHLREILALARREYRWVVLDVATEFAADEVLMYDTLAPVRNGITVAAMEESDNVLALTGPDPIALQRLVARWPALQDLGVTARVVLTKARVTAVGGNPSVIIARAIERFASIELWHVLPDAREELDEALLSGTVLTRTKPGGEYAQAIRELAQLLGAPAQAPTTRRRRLRVLGRG